MFLFVLIKTIPRERNCKISKKFFPPISICFLIILTFASDAQVRYQRVVADSEKYKKANPEMCRRCQDIW